MVRVCLGRRGGWIWAGVSAVVVLQPGVEQSLQASVFRIAANVIGASVGFACGSLLGTGLLPMLLGMWIVVLCCLALRLEQSLRTACVSVIIVVSNSLGNVSTGSVQRVSAVMIGSTLAVAVQYLLQQALHRAWPAAAAHAPAAATAAHSPLPRRGDE